MASPFIVSIDGEQLDPAEASISVTDDGFVRGDGVFEMIRIYHGKPFAWTEHFDRLERSADGTHLPLDRALLEREATALLSAAENPDCNMRIILTRGGRRVVMLEPTIVHPETVTVTTVTFSQNVVLTGVKSLSYGANEHATRVAAEQGADEAVLVRPDGIVLEAPTSSIFWIASDGRLHTPTLKLGILDSITRSFLVRELDVEEGEFSEEELHRTEEAFLASTTREVQTIAAISGRKTMMSIECTVAYPFSRSTSSTAMVPRPRK